MAQDLTPSFIADTNAKIDITILSTDALVNEQGYTYNQAAMTYNEPGVAYGGIYNFNEDIIPLFADNNATLQSPLISSIIDIGAEKHYRYSLGPGWFMFVTYDRYTP